MDKQTEKQSQDKINAARGVKSPNPVEECAPKNDTASEESTTAKERLDERARKAGC